MAIRRFAFLFLLVFVPLAASAEAADSTYQRLLSITNPQRRVDAFNREIERCWNNGAYEKGLRYGEKAIKLAQAVHYRKGEADALNNIGIIYDYKGSYAEALSAYFKALAIQEKLRDLKGIAYTCSNIGLIYSNPNQKQFDEALKYQLRSLRIRQQLQFKPGISASHNNLGLVYMSQQKSELALHHFFASIAIDTETGDQLGIGDSYNNVGLIYMLQDNYAKAEEYFLKSAEIRKRMKNLHGIANSYSNLGTLYSRKRDYANAKNWLQRALTLEQQLGAKDGIKYCYQQLYEIAQEEGNYKDAFAYYKEYVRYGDLIANYNSTREQTQTEMRYAFAKQQNEERLQQQERDLTAKRAREFVQTVLWSVVVLALITLVFSLFLYQRWKIAREQKTVIEEKNRLVEIKNREILDSISYAKRIQSAILPPERLVKEFLVNSFILYKPKDIVAGDFYWMEAQENKVIFAAADCTGHGVPGALISVVCHNALNRAVREFGLSSPGAILDKTREIIIQEFAKSEDDVNDGMDISLCTLDLETLQLEWSGANNPLWIVRNGGHEVEECKANKQPIGKYSKYESFQTHRFQLAPGDSLYLFTDGFADQFGGDDQKKYKSKQMKELILQVQHLSMEQQRVVFDQTFEAWKGELEQVDDVCVLGIRV